MTLGGLTFGCMLATCLCSRGENGHKVSLSKLQYCQPQVEYLGQVVARGTRAVAPSQLEGISKLPKSMTVGQMMTFLGMTGFSVDWIEDYAIKAAPLREIMNEAGSKTLNMPLKWTLDAQVAFVSLKQDLQTAPVLALPDYSKDFHLYVANRCDKYASAVLMQETCSGRTKQPIAHYSTKLYNVAQGWPPCYQGSAALHYAYEKASVLTMGYPVIIYSHQKIIEMLENGRFVLTQAHVSYDVT